MPSPSSVSKPVIIVGGGLSGLAAAVELTSHHIPVLLLEQKPRLGGRAYSFVDSTTGDVIDNGQHVLIAGYEHTLRFLERIGTKHLLTIQENPVLGFHHPTRGFCRFAIGELPSPLHLLGGILTSNLFPFSDKLRMIRAGIALTMGNVRERMTIEQWLDSVGQSGETKRSFWEPLAISIMNEHITRASARVFVHSLRLAFLRSRKNSALAIPRVGLSELYVNAAANYISERCGQVHTNADVATILFENEMVSGVRLNDGTEFAGSAVILAVPHYRINGLLPEDVIELPPPLVQARSTPIVSIHLWFDEDFMSHDVLGVIERRVQWIFNKRRINHESGNGGHISCVISAADEFVDLTNDELVTIAMQDVRSVYASVPEAPSHAIVIREKRATFSCTPEADLVRPPHETRVSNLFLAGDWTRTALPATIEGAVLSGNACAFLAKHAIEER